MVGLPHNKSLHPALPLLATLGCRRVGGEFAKGGLWDPSLDAPSLLEKTLLPTKAQEELNNLEEDQLIGQTVRQLGQA